jgi:hypothetical protein
MNIANLVPNFIVAKLFVMNHGVYLCSSVAFPLASHSALSGAHETRPNFNRFACPGEKTKAACKLTRIGWQMDLLIGMVASLVHESWIK